MAVIVTQVKDGLDGTSILCNDEFCYQILDSLLRLNKEDKDGGMEGETERRADEGEGFADVADKFGKECGNGGRDEAGEDGAGRDEEGQGEKRRVAAGGRGGGEVRGTHLFPIGFPATPSTSPHHHPPRPLERPSALTSSPSDPQPRLPPRPKTTPLALCIHLFPNGSAAPPAASPHHPSRPVERPSALSLCLHAAAPPALLNFQLLSLPPSPSPSPSLSLSQALTSSPWDPLPHLPPLPTTTRHNIPLALWSALPPWLSACTPQLPPRSLISNFFLYPPPPPPPHPHPRHSPLPHGIPCRTFRLSPPPPATTSLSPSGAPFRLGSLPARRCSPLAALLLALHRPASSSGERGSGNAPQSDAALALCLHAAALPRAALLLAFHRAASATGECTSGDAPQSDAEVAMHRKVMQVSETPPFSRPLASSPPAASSRECGSGDAQVESDACKACYSIHRFPEAITDRQRAVALLAASAAHFNPSSSGNGYHPSDLPRALLALQEQSQQLPPLRTTRGAARRDNPLSSFPVTPLFSLSQGKGPACGMEGAVLQNTKAQGAPIAFMLIFAHPTPSHAIPSLQSLSQGQALHGAGRVQEAVCIGGDTEQARVCIFWPIHHHSPMLGCLTLPHSLSQGQALHAAGRVQEAVEAVEAGVQEAVEANERATALLSSQNLTSPATSAPSSSADTSTAAASAEDTSAAASSAEWVMTTSAAWALVGLSYHWLPDADKAERAFRLAVEADPR
ncbi:unnamed protein product [Closterium sp. Naga37s-1]|nr:unnamed protein product [Closterium sp. Naga37s-1]